MNGLLTRDNKSCSFLALEVEAPVYMTLCIRVADAIAAVRPTSKPFIPAQILMEFVQNMSRSLERIIFQEVVSESRSGGPTLWDSHQTTLGLPETPVGAEDVCGIHSGEVGIKRSAVLEALSSEVQALGSTARWLMEHPMKMSSMS
ncbi:hypothetical protein F0562_018046 [Nyssa sinensis]|uniref:Uncharacterized protein n=1 Tax=Nyssa sinensis TaxID=561372 RepID=A0A5J4ZBY0_9ASTE|nr:hypothetical protein F0562_018046 [Nyssa sinensis]